MILWLIYTLVGLVIIGVASTIFSRKMTCLVPEDNAAVTVDRNGFIKRVLPPGRYTLRPFEKVEFTVETKNKLASQRVASVVTAEGIPVTIHWSGTYSLQLDLIVERRSQRLRGLLQAERSISRQADIYLRKLLGLYTLADLFRPAIRNRLERQLNQALADQLKPMGIIFNGLSLQTLELPGEVAEAFNKAEAIKALDGAIRQLDPATREIVRGVYQLDEVLRWDAYLPAPSRLTLKQMQAAGRPG